MWMVCFQCYSALWLCSSIAPFCTTLWVVLRSNRVALFHQVQLSAGFIPRFEAALNALAMENLVNFPYDSKDEERRYPIPFGMRHFYFMPLRQFEYALATRVYVKKNWGSFTKIVCAPIPVSADVVGLFPSAVDSTVRIYICIYIHIYPATSPAKII